MKQSASTETIGSSSPLVKFSPDDEWENKENVQAHNGLQFPSSTFGLWNSTSWGDSIELKIPHEQPVTLLCLERCLRIAHRHASHTKHENSRQSYQNEFDGFLLGSTKYADEEGSVMISLDRFDPGIIRSGIKSPSTPLPGDVVVPVIFTGEFSDESRISNVFAVHDYENVFKLLHHQISSHLSLENTSLFPIRLVCYCNKAGSSDEETQLQMCLVTPCISNTMSVTPIKPVPIIPTALAKNLSSPLNLSQVQNSSKTGYITMNQARKILLMLDSDPKSKSVPTVGIWVSGVVSAHHPVVWLSCMRYLYCSDVYDRIMNKNQQFLLVLYSITSAAPMFFQVSSDAGGKLNFDLLYAEKCLSICKQAIGNFERDIEFRFLSSSSSIPNIMFKERQIFQEALDRSEPFLAPRNRKETRSREMSDENEYDESENFVEGMLMKENVVSNGQQLLKKPGMKPSILKKKSGDTKNKIAPNGVSFLSAGSLPGAGALPLPSPQPTPALQCPSMIRPTVPELSLVFDENYSANTVASHSSSSNQVSISTKKNWPSQHVRSPLRTLYTTTTLSGGHSEVNGHSSFTANAFKQQQNHNSATRNQSGGTRYGGRGHRCSVVPSRARRTHSASDVTRGQDTRNMTQQVPHPYNPHSPYSPMQNVPTPCTRSTAPHYHMNSDAAYQRLVVPGAQYRPAVDYRPLASISNPHSYPVCYPQVNPHLSPQYYHTAHTTQSSTRYGFPSRHEFQNTTAVTSFNPAVNSPNGVSACAIPSCSQGNAFPAARSSHDLSAVPRENPPDWMKQLPPEAYQLLMQQDSKLKELQAQIQKLLESQTMQIAKKPTTNSSASTDTDDLVPETHSTAVNTGTSLYMSSLNGSGRAEDRTDTNSGTSTELSSEHSSKSTSEASGNLKRASGKSPDSNASPHFLKPTKPADSFRSVSQCSNKGQSSEFASILLDDCNLLEIKKANVEDDNDVRSIASSLRAVDLPVLDISADRSSLNTPTRNLGVNTWDVQESPVLGESASMCIVPPLNLEDGSSQEGIDNEPDTVRQTEAKDGMFMQNLLSQVRVMLQKVDLEGTSDISSNQSGSTAHSDSKRIKSKKARSHEDRVAIATRKQLKKMGVVLDDEVVNALTTAVAKEKRISSDDYPCTFPEPLIPRLNYESVLTASCEYSTLLQGPSSTELSMHANAIALKYLSNNQLEEIASLSKLGKSVQYSPARANRSMENGDTDPEIVSLGNQSFTKIAGMSLVSPCNMSLATRKYMQKYGLIEGEEESDDEEEGEENEPKLTDEQTNLFNKNEMNHGFSDIKVNLGDTLDMISPFLNDLDLHKQKAPSSGQNNAGSTSSRSSEHAKDKIRNRPNAGSTQDDYRNPESVPPNEKQRELTTGTGARNRRRFEATEDVGDSQILSPKLLQVLAEGKKLSPTHSNRGKSPYFHSSDKMKYERALQKHEEEEEFLSETWPQNHFQMRKPLQVNSSDHPGDDITQCPFLHKDEDFHLTSSRSARNHDHGRQRSSPPSNFRSRLHKIRAIHDPSHNRALENLREVIANRAGERRNVDEGEVDQPILSSEVMNSFEGKDSKSNPNPRSSQDDVTHFLQHLQREYNDSR